MNYKDVLVTRATFMVAALAGEVLDAAVRTVYTPKIVALGRALAAGAMADDSSHVELQRRLVEILVSLEYPHVRLLELMIDKMWRYQELVDRQKDLWADPAAWSIRSLAAALPDLAMLMGNYVATLERHHLIEDASPTPSEAIREWESRTSTSPIVREERKWKATRIGESCLSVLRQTPTGGIT